MRKSLLKGGKVCELLLLQLKDILLHLKINQVCRGKTTITVQKRDAKFLFAQINATRYLLAGTTTMNIVVVRAHFRLEQVAK